MQRLSTSQKELLEEVTAQAQADLSESQRVSEYLAARGLSRRACDDFRLGAVVNPLPGYERFEGMLCIPNMCGAADNHVVGVKFRDLSPDAKKKYDQPSGQEARLFNLRDIKKAQRGGVVYVTEGEIDAITIGSLGYPVVGLPGASSFEGKGTRHRYRIFDGLTVILCKDSDPAGEKLAGLLATNMDQIEIRDPGAKFNDVNNLWVNGFEQDEESMSMWLEGVL